MLLFLLRGRTGKEQVLPVLQQLLSYQQERQEVDSKSSWLRNLSSAKAHSGGEQWADIEVMSEGLLQLSRLLMGLAEDALSVRLVKEKLAEQLSEGYSSFRQVNKKQLEGMIQDRERGK